MATKFKSYKKLATDERNAQQLKGMEYHDAKRREHRDAAEKAPPAGNERAMHVAASMAHEKAAQEHFGQTEKAAGWSKEAEQLSSKAAKTKDPVDAGGHAERRAAAVKSALGDKYEAHMKNLTSDDAMTRVDAEEAIAAEHGEDVAEAAVTHAHHEKHGEQKDSEPGKDSSTKALNKQRNEKDLQKLEKKVAAKGGGEKKEAEQKNIETGARGGRFYTTPSGAKIYVGGG